MQNTEQINKILSDVAELKDTLTSSMQELSQQLSRGIDDLKRLHKHMEYRKFESELTNHM